jgi:predicted Zn-dependent peptidase
MVRQSPNLTTPWTAGRAAAARLRPGLALPGPRVGETCYRRTTLENGIRVVTEAMPAARSLTLGILVQAGPRDEPPEQSGLAHLTEHLLFQGTSTRDARQIARFMDLAGGQFGGFTTRDYTCYAATVLDEHYPYALDLLGDLFLNATFPAESLKREKAAILCEMEASRDAPAERVHECLKQAVWPDHALGRPLTGRPETVRRLTREDLIYFFHRHYVPDQIVVAAAGRLEHDDFTAQVRDGFWPMLGQADPVPATAPDHHAGAVLEHAPVSQAYFALGVPACPYAHPQRYGLHVLNNLLGGGVSSRLVSRLREERGLVYHIASDYLAYRDAGLLVVEGSTAPENLSAVLGLTLVELWRLAAGDEPVSEDELWRAGVQMRRQHLLAGEATATRMSRLATQEIYFGRYLPAEEIAAALEAVDRPALERVAAEVLLPGLPQATVAVVGPEAPDHYSPGALEALLGQFR